MGVKGSQVQILSARLTGSDLSTHFGPRFHARRTPPLPPGDRNPSEALLPTALTLGLLGLAVLPQGTGRFLTRRGARSLWKANPSLALPVESSLSADGLRFQNASSETRHDWSAFSGWIESESVIVLCLSNFKGAFLTLPTRAITGADVHQRLRALLIEHLGPALVTRGQVRSQQLHHKASA
ncbi:YcxB family protein [Pedococcus bigeumensis]|uniref:YcxB family protein n=1 Tax=Pedococcus bigeumensis TaxID=433644 RepID=A0A502CXR4_9MICO|nr:YcxB family protein [Pedococcus bigeumensis]